MLHRIVGIDPGIVHTGVVMLDFEEITRTRDVVYQVFNGVSHTTLDTLSTTVNKMIPTTVFIEGYRTRSNFMHDNEMVAAVSELKRLISNSTVLDNTGVTKVILPDLMKVLDCWSFPQSTHHQDLRSAARIALLGMVKDEKLNRVLTDVITSHIDGHPWSLVK